MLHEKRILLNKILIGINYAGDVIAGRLVSTLSSNHHPVKCCTLDNLKNYCSNPTLSAKL